MTILLNLGEQNEKSLAMFEAWRATENCMVYYRVEDLHKDIPKWSVTEWQEWLNEQVNKKIVSRDLEPTGYYYRIRAKHRKYKKEVKTFSEKETQEMVLKFIEKRIKQCKRDIAWCGKLKLKVMNIWFTDHLLGLQEAETLLKKTLKTT